MASFFHDAHNTVWRLGLSGGGALDQVFGVDLNPLAVAIARFLLLLAALHVRDIHRLAVPFMGQVFAFLALPFLLQQANVRCTSWFINFLD
jgi:hypothetical protein